MTAHRRLLGAILMLAGVILSLGFSAPRAGAQPSYSVYVANLYSRSVTPFMLPGDVAEPRIAVGSDPSGLAVSPDGRSVYVASGAGLSTIDAASNALESTIDLGPSHAVVVTPNGETAYVSSDGGGATPPSPMGTTMAARGTVTPVDLQTGTPGPAITVGSQPRALAVTPNGSTVYVADLGSDSVTPIDTGSNLAGPAIQLTDIPYALAVSPDGDTLYVTSADGTLTMISTASNTVTRAITIGRGQEEGIAISPDGSTAYVDGDGTLTPVDLTTSTLGAAIPVGQNPYGVAITPDGATVYVANLGSTSITPVDTATSTPGTAISAGPSPVALAITSTVLPAAAAPILGALRESHARWRVGHSAARILGEARRRSIALPAAGRYARRRKPIPVGTTFLFTLTEAATLTVTFTEKHHGRSVTRGRLTLDGHAGADRLAFSGHLSPSQVLAPGDYVVAITATNGRGRRSRTAHITFRIVR